MHPPLSLLWRTAACLLYFGSIDAQAFAEPVMQTPAQIEAVVSKIRQVPKSDEFQVDDPVRSRRLRMIRRLPPEAVPILIRDLQEATVESDKWDYVTLLAIKLSQFGNLLPDNIRQAGIDLLIAKCAQTHGFEQRVVLINLKGIDDPKIDQFIERLAASQDAEDQKTAATFKNGRDLASLRKKPVSQTSDQIAANIVRMMHPQGSSEMHIIEELPPESIPVLAQNLRASQDEKERWHYMQFLSFKLSQFEDDVPASVRQDAIDAMINECSRAKGKEIYRRVKKLTNFDDPKIDQLINEMTKSQDADARTAAGAAILSRSK